MFLIFVFFLCLLLIIFFKLVFLGCYLLHVGISVFLYTLFAHLYTVFLLLMFNINVKKIHELSQGDNRK